jgi:hypothetical protein
MTKKQREREDMENITLLLIIMCENFIKNLTELRDLDDGLDQDTPSDA